MKMIFTSFWMAAAIAASAATSIASPILPPPTPPPAPSIKVAWNLPPSNQITNVALWWGVGSGQYTNRYLVGNVTNTTVVLPGRGVTFYMVVTPIYQGDLQAPWSNEINYTPIDPLPAIMSPPLTLVVQSKTLSNPGSSWETFLTQSLDPNTKGTAYQLKLVAGNGPPSPQMRALAAMRSVINQPPSPITQ